MTKSLTITATTDLTTLPAAARRGISSAYSALSALEPSPARIKRAAKAVGTLRGYGLSIRGIVAVLSVEGNGTLPTGKGTVERLGYVADALTGEWPDTGDSTDAIVMALYRIAQTGKAADVARAAEAGRKSTDGESAYTAVDAIRQELNAAEYRSLTTAPERSTGGETADGGKQSADAEPTDAEPTDDDDVTTGEVATTLRGVGTGALIAELTRRYSGSRASVLSDDADALVALVSRVEALITAGRVASKR